MQAIFFFHQSKHETVIGTIKGYNRGAVTGDYTCPITMYNPR
jgi:hypothetical protein